MTEDTTPVPQHHVRLPICATRKRYRDGRRDTAVKVYTISQESRYLMITGVPAVGASEELVKLCALYGQVEEYRIIDEYPTAEEHTEVYWVKFQKIQAAKVAKRKLDDYSFFGGVLHVFYSPEYETVDDTRQKLIGRRRQVAAQLRRLLDQQNGSTSVPGPTSSSSIVPPAIPPTVPPAVPPTVPPAVQSLTVPVGPARSVKHGGDGTVNTRFNQSPSSLAAVASGTQSLPSYNNPYSNFPPGYGPLGNGPPGYGPLGNGPPGYGPPVYGPPDHRFPLVQPPWHTRRDPRPPDLATYPSNQYLGSSHHATLHVTPSAIKRPREETTPRNPESSKPETNARVVCGVIVKKCLKSSTTPKFVPRQVRQVPLKTAPPAPTRENDELDSVIRKNAFILGPACGPNQKPGPAQEANHKLSTEEVSIERTMSAIRDRLKTLCPTLLPRQLRKRKPPPADNTT